MLLYPPVEEELRTLLCSFHLRRRLLNFRGAEFEFWNLAERIELRIGEQVRGRLDEGEWNEHHTVRHGIILTRVQLDRPAARADADQNAPPDAEVGKGAARHGGNR